MDDIDGFLASQRESGQIDSEGVFTIALEKARQKLGQFQLEDPSFYLLKVVQAAVGAGTSRIEVHRSKEKLELLFDAPSPLGTPEVMLRALGSPVEVSDGPLRWLAIGFNSALFASPLRTSLTWWSPDASGMLTATGDEVTIAQPPSPPAHLSENPFLYRFSVAKARKGFFESTTAAEVEALTKGCGYCPIEIRVDGLPLPVAGHPPPRNEPWLEDYSEPFHLVERLDLDLEGKVKLAVSSFASRRRGHSGWLRTSRSTDAFCVQPVQPLEPEMRCRHAYALPLALSGPDKIHFVRHGVKVATVSLSAHGAGATAVMCADELSFDLSGLGVIRNAVFYSLVETAYEAWREMALTVNRDLDELTSAPTKRERQADSARHQESCGCSCLGGFLALLGVGAIPFLGPEPAALFAVLSTMGGALFPLLRSQPDRQTGLRDAVRQRLQKLGSHWPRD